MIKKLFTEKNTSLAIEFLAVASVLFFSLVVFSSNTFSFGFYHNGDVHRGFHRGLDVWAGVNSYKSFDLENMVTQEKVPGFFPLYFYLMAFFVWLSDFSFVQFIDTLRVFIFFFYISIGLIIYFYLRKSGILTAIFGMSLFMFNRWTVFDVISLKQESYVLLLLLISIFLLKKNKYLAFFVFGLATGIKHLTILIAPLYFLDFYTNTLSQKIKNIFNFKYLAQFILCLILYLSPIVIPSLWYIADDPNKFFSSIIFNVTREPESVTNSDYIIGLDKALILYNLDYSNLFLLVLPRFPMLIMLILVNIFYYKLKIDKWLYIAFTYLVFICFNPTLFNQYMVWFMAFFPFVFKDIIRQMLELKKAKNL